MKDKIHALIVLALTICSLAGAGCPDAVREGAVMGLGDLTESAITIPLSILAMGLELFQQALIESIVSAL